MSLASSEGKLGRLSRVPGRVPATGRDHLGDLRARVSLEVRGALAGAELSLSLLQVIYLSRKSVVQSLLCATLRVDG